MRRIKTEQEFTAQYGEPLKNHHMVLWVSTTPTGYFFHNRMIHLFGKALSYTEDHELSKTGKCRVISDNEPSWIVDSWMTEEIELEICDE